MGRTTAEVIIDTLYNLGVERIYGIPGDSLNPVMDAIRKNGQIQFIQVRHEEGAALAASFESKISGKVTACMGTSGPGSIHLLNGLYDAKMDHSSVIALTGQVETELIGTDYFQEVNLGSIFQDVSLYSAEIISPKSAQEPAKRAFREAKYRGGVSHLTLPADVMRLPSEYNEELMEQAPVLPVYNPDLSEVNSLIEKSSSPVLFIGKGARGCGGQILDLSEKIGAPVIYALNGKGIVDDLDRRVAGSLGLLGTKPSVKAIENADLLIMIGSSYPYIQFIPEKLMTIQVDTNPVSIGKRRRSDLGLICDAKTFLNLLDVKPKEEKYYHRIESEKKEWISNLEKREQYGKGLIRPESVPAIISKYAEKNATVVVDTGNVTVWGVRNFRTGPGRTFVYSSWLGSMGIGIPGTVGASYSSGNQIIGLIGDGSFAMSLPELATIKKYKRPVKLFVFNNSELGMIKFEEEVMGFPNFGTDLFPLNFAKIGEAIGIKSFRVEKYDQLEPAIKESLSIVGEPTIVDVVIDPDEAPMPPKLNFSQVKGYVTSLLKERLE
ncbi:MAG: thiamine pyrophosphate-binding protein [Candidatus Thermoplasmatota archaeon]|nr:thiamine pyrophosphate-binding protein [Candidatus Thermoplasmatota archaeon]